MTDENEAEGRRIGSVDRAFDVMEHLREAGPSTLTDIAEEFGMPMSTAHIHLTTLVANEYVIKEDGMYRLSLRFLRTAGELRSGLPMFEAAKPEVDGLASELGENTNLVCREEGYVVQLYKSESPDSIDDNPPIGAYFHLHATATGKAVLSELPEPAVESIIDETGLPEHTNSTVTDREELFEELDRVRERKYAINRGEHYPGVCAVGTSILSESEGVLGGISISGPRSRIGIDRIEEELAPALLDRRNVIELKLRQSS